MHSQNKCQLYLLLIILVSLLNVSNSSYTLYTPTHTECIAKNRFHSYFSSWVYCSQDYCLNSSSNSSHKMNPIKQNIQNINYICFLMAFLAYMSVTWLPGLFPITDTGKSSFGWAYNHTICEICRYTDALIHTPTNTHAYLHTHVYTHTSTTSLFCIDPLSHPELGLVFKGFWDLSSWTSDLSPLHLVLVQGLCPLLLMGTLQINRHSAFCTVCVCRYIYTQSCLHINRQYILYSKWGCLHKDSTVYPKLWGLSRHQHYTFCTVYH